MTKLLKLPAKIDKKLNGEKYASDGLVEAQNWLNYLDNNLSQIRNYVNEIADRKGL